MTTKLDVLNEGLSGWRELPAGVFRLAMALWELSDSKPRQGLHVIGRAKVATIARYANVSPSQAHRSMATLRALGLLDTKAHAGRYLRFRLRPHAQKREEVAPIRHDSTGGNARAIYPVVLTQLSTPSSSPYPLQREVAG
jgi:hypothetical protein